jgi:hypothetical protein
VVLGNHPISVRSMMILRAVNLAALLAAFAWWGRQGGWEPAATSLSLLGAFLYQESGSYSGARTHDKKLYEKFLKEFPSNGSSLRLLKEHDFGGSFLAENLNDFHEFLETWQNAEQEFNNKKLNSYLRSLIQKSNEFNTEYLQHVFANPGGVRTMDLKDWEDRPEKLLVRGKLNKLSTQVYYAHQEMVRQGRRLL